MIFSFGMEDALGLSPELPERADWEKWAASGSPFPASDGRVSSPDIPMMLSRRLLPGDRAAVEVMLRLQQETSLMPDCIIFASRHGELLRSVTMLSSLAGDGTVSPTEFSNSVQNTPAAYYSMVSGNHAESVSLSSGDDIVAMALSEAYAAISSGDAKCCGLVFYENPVSNSIMEIPSDGPAYGTFAAGFILRKGSSFTIESGLAGTLDPVQLMRYVLRGGDGDVAA